MPIGCQSMHVIWFLNKGETEMNHTGNKDRGSKNKKKKPKLTIKEKRKLKQEKKKNTNLSSTL